jgi:beta-phosphoglucomutase-like phosphatase (HAD superfamily)
MPHVRDVLAAIDQPYCVATSSSPMRANSSLDLVGLSHLAGSRLFTGGSHLPKPLGPEPEDARPHRHFDSFATFFTLDPRLRSRP